MELGLRLRDTVPTKPWKALASIPSKERREARGRDREGDNRGDFHYYLFSEFCLVLPAM